MYDTSDNSSVPRLQQEPTAPAQASWRNTIKVHAAAELFPLMGKTELTELGNNIKTNTLISPIVLWLASKDAQAQLLDGRNRLDALEAVLGRSVRVTSRTYRGHTTWSLEADDDYGDSVSIDYLLGDKGFPIGAQAESIFIVLGADTDPYAYVAAANLHRRHLTPEDRRDAIAKLLKVDPSKSDRQIGKMINADNKTVAAVRAEREAREEIPHVPTRTDAKGRRQPARKSKPSAPAAGGKAESALAEGTKPLPVESDSVGKTVPNTHVEELEDRLRHFENQNSALRVEVRELKAALANKLAGISNEQLLTELKRRLSSQFLRTHQVAMKAIARALKTLELEVIPVADTAVTQH